MGKQEKNIINLFKNNIIKEEVITDIGEDCAVLYPMQSRNIIISTDSISVGVHFNSNNTPYSIGRHLIETSLSDLACMGAEPVFAILNISFLKFDKKWVKKFARGVTETAENYNIKIIGGDTIKGKENFSCTVIGYATSQNTMLISSAQENDNIFTSGIIGNGYYTRKNKTIRPLNIKFELGKMLCNFANTCIDLSDGLFSGIKSITNGKGADINIIEIPLPKKYKSIKKNSKKIQKFLSYGQDYELLFTIPDSKINQAKTACKSLGFEIFHIGRITSKKNSIKFLDGNKKIDFDLSKEYEHF